MAPSKVAPPKPICAIASRPVCRVGHKTTTPGRESPRLPPLLLVVGVGGLAVGGCVGDGCTPTVRHLLSLAVQVSRVSSNSLITRAWNAHCSQPGSQPGRR